MMYDDPCICPCGKPNHCALAEGHSISICWCLEVPVRLDNLPESDTCLCPECLDKYRRDSPDEDISVKPHETRVCP
ncbi:MAG: cysteine-rich CWC family protein [Capsulimonadaceae bacterium]